MTTIGTLQQKHSRNYIYLNPSITEGPNTWRLSNLNEGDSQQCIQDIWTIAPIVKTQSGTDAVLSFDISSIPKTVSEASVTLKDLQEIAASVMVSQPPGGYINCAFDDIETELPVNSIQANKDLTVWFDIRGLKSIDAARDVVESDDSGYNRSVATLVAEEPLFVDTVAKKAKITFDMSNLATV